MTKTKILTCIACAFLISACQGEKSPKVVALQKKDKNLNCSEVMLEMNEAEFYRRTAEKNKGPGVKSILMPLGYVSTYIDAEEAVESADSRVEYLNRIYEILECDKKGSGARRASSPSGYYVPNGYYPSYEEGDGGEMPISSRPYENLGTDINNNIRKSDHLNDLM